MKELQTKQKTIDAMFRFHTELEALGLGLSSEVGEVNDLIAKITGLKYPKPNDDTSNMTEKLAGELADVLCYLLKIANAADIDLEAAYHEKVNIVKERFQDRIMQN